MEINLTKFEEQENRTPLGCRDMVYYNFSFEYVCTVALCNNRRTL